MDPLPCIFHDRHPLAFINPDQEPLTVSQALDKLVKILRIKFDILKTFTCYDAAFLFLVFQSQVRVFKKFLKT